MRKIISKRILSAVLACLLAFSVAGCGSDGSGQGGKNGQDEAQSGQDGAQDGQGTAQGGAQGAENGANGQQGDSASAVWIGEGTEEPALDWSAVEPAPEEDFVFCFVVLRDIQGARIDEYRGEGGVVKIPSTLGGKPVIEIDSYVFSESGITDVYFEAAAPAYIRSRVFQDCETLNSVVIKGDEKTQLEGHIFENCTNLTSVVLSGEITNIWEFVFWGTPWLESKKQEAPLVIVNNVLLDATLYEGDLIIPDGVIKVAPYAAYENENITSLTIPDSVQNIGAGSFGKCTQLTRVLLPDRINGISGQFGFAGDPEIVVTYRGTDYTYEELEDLDLMTREDYEGGL